MRIGVIGASGRMGVMLLRELAEDPELELVGAVAAPGDAALGVDSGLHAGLAPNGVVISERADPVFQAADCVIDFTTASAIPRHATLAEAFDTAMVVGTTGLNQAEQTAIARAAERVAVVQASNMSLGVAVLTTVAEQVARALGDRYDVEIIEMHHRRKIDAPSGTALTLGEAVARGLGLDLAAAKHAGRDGVTGPRRADSIGFASLRGGDVVGDHTVIFAGEGERIEITHRATDRRIFAAGAVRAARWTKGRPPGLYGIRDVLGLG